MEDKSGLRAVSGTTVLGKTMHRELILGDHIGRGEIVMIYAPTGQGKTYNALSFGISLSCGLDCWGWKCHAKKRVLYIDGEMTVRGLTPRIQGLAKGLGVTSLDDFNIIGPDLTSSFSMPNISTPEHQIYYDNLINTYKAEVIILDNYNTLTSSGKGMDDEMSGWQKIEDWFRKLRARRITVVLIHHTNAENNRESGTVRKVNFCDFVMRIQKSVLSTEVERYIEFEVKKNRWGENPPLMLNRLIVDEAGSRLVREDYQAVLTQRIKEDLDKYDEKYVAAKYGFLGYKLREYLKVISQSVVDNHLQRDQEDENDSGFSKFF